MRHSGANDTGDQARGSDIEQLTRVDRIGHRIAANRYQVLLSRAVADEKSRVEGYGATSPPYTEVLPDEQGPTTVGFEQFVSLNQEPKVIEWLRVLRLSGSAYEAYGWRKAAGALGLMVKKNQAMHPLNDHQAAAVWLPSDFVCTKAMLEVWVHVAP